MNIGSSYLKIPDFRNIIHLKLTLPLMNNFWSSLQSLDQLTSLEITLIEGCTYLPLQTLLDRSPRLYSLCFGNFSNFQIVSKLTSKSIHRLDFLKKNTYKKYLNSTQCSMLSNSSLGRQCKHLLIYVENRMNVLQIVKTMFNLQSLILQCKDDKFNDEYIHWLQRHLPATYSIIRDMQQTTNIRLWID